MEQRRLNLNKNIFIIVPLSFVLIVLTLNVFAKEKDKTTTIYGVWIEVKKHKVAVIIEDCENQLCGHIYWLKKPFSATGKRKLDVNNPDHSLRGRPQCGLTILSGFSKSKKSNLWRGGKIYDPKSGKTYKSNIRISKDGLLKVRGYIGISLFGRTVKWQRPEKELTPCD